MDMWLVYLIKRVAILFTYLRRASYRWSNENVPRIICLVYIFRAKEKESLVGESPTQRSSMCKIDGSKRMTCLWKQVHFVRLIMNQFKDF
jgi:hypothetical protein